MGQNRKRNETGEYATRVTDDDVLRALRDHREPVATAGDLATVLDVSTETVRRHLTALHNDERVGRKQAGSRAVVWWDATERAAAAPAGPLYELIGMLDDDEADRLRERSREVREEFDERVGRTRRDLVGEGGSEER